MYSTQWGRRTAVLPRFTVPWLNANGANPDRPLALRLPIRVIFVHMSTDSSKEPTIGKRRRKEFPPSYPTCKKSARKLELAGYSARLVGPSIIYKVHEHYPGLKYAIALNFSQFPISCFI